MIRNCRSILFVILAITAACGTETPTADHVSVLVGELVRESKTVVLGINRLSPGQFQLRHVSVSFDSARSNYKLDGDFTVSDGFSIEAFLVKREDVPMLVDGGSVDRLWRTGVRREAEWALGMADEGEYTFVLDNRVGEAEWKSVNTRLVLSWDTIQTSLKP